MELGKIVISCLAALSPFELDGQQGGWTECPSCWVVIKLVGCSIHSQNSRGAGGWLPRDRSAEVQA